MKEKIAKFLVRLADKIYPEKIARVPAVENYESGKIAIGFVISPSQIKDYARKKMVSYSEASKILIAESKDRIKEAIWLRIEKDSMIENRVLFTKEGTQVEGWLKVYVKKERGKKAMP